jgi:hypothetical protein
MRGGLDDALDKLARRDQLRRRAQGDAAGTPPAVNELVEAIAAVVGRNPQLEVTVGVEGAGDPLLLHFAMEDGVVQVSADNSVAARAAEAATPRHADFEVEPEEPYSPPPAYAGQYPADPPDYSPGPSEAFFTDPSNGFGPVQQQHPFAAAPPPPIPPQTSRAPHIEQHRAPEERGPVLPEPLPEPVPLRIDTEETEAATKRLAALLRDNPTLLRQAPPE